MAPFLPRCARFCLLGGALLSLGASGDRVHPPRAAAFVSPPQRVQCDVGGSEVELTWTNPLRYDALVVYRDGVEFQTLYGDRFHCVDPVPRAGWSAYVLEGILGGASGRSAPCRVFHPGDASDLVWAPPLTAGGATPSAHAILTALEANGRVPLRVESLAPRSALLEFDSVWVSLGTFPHNHVLTDSEAELLATYAEDTAEHRVLYLEGGNTWADDPQTPLHALFGVIPRGGGADDLATQIATRRFCHFVFDADYEGENLSIDRLLAAPDAVALFRNRDPEFDTAVVRMLPSGTVVFGASHEFGGLRPLRGTPSDVLAVYLECGGLLRTISLDPVSGPSPLGPTPPTLISLTPDHGTPLGGDTVTLSGTDFTASTSVDFGASPAASVVFVDASTLDAVTPPGSPGVVNVTVANASGSDTSVGAFTYDAPPAITSVTPASGTPVGGTSVTIGGTDLTSTTTVTFGGTLATGVTLIDATSLTCTTPAHSPGTVSVAVGNENGSGMLASAFTYNNPPTLSTLSPVSGTPQGGDTVTIAGADFTPATAVTFGGIPAASVTFVAASTLNAVTPAHSPGTVDVGISNVNGNDILAGAFTFNNPPTVTTVSPDHGPPLGGDTVVIAGTDFTPGIAVTFGGTPAASVTFVADTTLNVVTPSHTPGAVDLDVSNANGSDTLAGGFVFDTPPTLTSLSPPDGSPLGGDTVTLTGADFTIDTTVDFDGTPTASVTFVDPSTLTVVTTPHAPGAVDVVVSNLNGIDTAAGAFTYLNGPTLSTLQPTLGAPAGGGLVTLSGMNLTASSVVTFDGVTATGVTWIDPNTLTAVIPAHPVGTVDVVVTNENGSDTLPGAFTYTDGPVLTAVNPTNGTPLGGNTVTLTGTNFTVATQVAFGATSAPSVTFVDATTLTAITPAHTPGPAVVTVLNGNGSHALVGGFVFNQPPTLTSISPNSGPPAGGTLVTLTGAEFTASTSVTFDGLPAPSLTLIDSMTLEASSPAHASGLITVTVTTINGSASLVDGFSYLFAPSIVDVNPATGTQLGGTNVTVTGSDFTPTTGVLFDGISAAATFVSTNVISANTPPHAAGSVDVEVVNENGGATLTGGFTYNPGPMLVSVVPAQGNLAGGQTVTISGSNFTAGSLVSFDGLNATVTFAQANTLEVTTPPHPVGSVDVVVATIDGTGTLFGGYDYVADPTLLAVNPDRAPLAGNTTVTLTGIGFLGGETVLFGADPASSVTFVNSQTLEVLTPALAAGIVDITASNPNGIGTLPQSFTVLPPPTVTTVTPNQGDVAGGTEVTLQGSDFSVSGDVGVTFAGAPGTVTAVMAGTSITVLSPPGVAGSVDVAVTTTGGSATASAAYTYLQLAFKRGDANDDGTLNIADGIFLIQYLFSPPSPAPDCFDGADANDDGLLDISDIIFNIAFIFLQGAQPPTPYPGCGTDPTLDGLECSIYDSC